MPRQTDLRYTFEPASGGAFDVVEFTLSEGLSEPFVLDVQLSCDDANVDFGSLLDQAALFTIWRKGEAVRHVHGLISRLTQETTGFRRTRYRAIVEPILARAGLRSSWRIFQQRSVPQILQSVVDEQAITAYEQHLTAAHETREYCVQVAETDLDFLARLAAEEGLLYAFTHDDKRHTLIHSDRIQSLGEIAGEPVVYNPSPGGDQAQVCVRRFSYTEQVRTAQQMQRDYTFKNPRYDQQHSIDGRDLDHQQSDYERYDYPGRYKKDAAGKPFTATRLTSLRRDARIAQIEGDDARIEPGKAFMLTGHPRNDLNIRWCAVRVTHQGKQLSSQQEESADSEHGTYYSQQAELIPATADWKAPIPPKPRIDGPQMATVTGPQGEEIYCDEWGRITVQFPWDRDGENNEHSSCWIRVSQNWAGGAWGHMAIPRIGQEVIVDFLDGDPDQPIVTGRTYHAINLPPYKLPDHKILSPIRSKEHHGSRFNELRLDDTTGQISAALMSDHAATALNIGYLTHPRPSGGVPRGEGFELRTDAHGVVRAGSGLLLTTERRTNAGEHHKDLPETAERLSVARDQQDTFGAMAREVLAQETGDQDEVAKALKAQHDAIQGQGATNAQANQYPELSAPHLVLASPAGIASTTPGSTHIASGEHIGLSSTGHTSVTAGKRLLASASRGMRLFVQSMGARLTAAAGDIDIKALKDSINLLAKLNVTVTAERITLSAKEELVINGAGSSTTYNAGGITHATGGSYKVQAADVNYSGPSSKADPFPEEPKPGQGSLELFNKYANKSGIESGAFEVEDALGQVFKGKLDAQGFAKVAGAAPGPASVVFDGDPSATWAADSRLSSPQGLLAAADMPELPLPMNILSDEWLSAAQQAQQAVQMAQSLVKGGGPAELIGALGSAGVVPGALGEQLDKASALFANGMPVSGQDAAGMASALLAVPSGDAAMSASMASDLNNPSTDIKKRLA